MGDRKVENINKQIKYFYKTAIRNWNTAEFLLEGRKYMLWLEKKYPPKYKMK